MKGRKIPTTYMCYQTVLPSKQPLAVRIAPSLTAKVWLESAWE
jgi:hypothetical protein